MFTLPEPYLNLIQHFAPLFYAPVWEAAQVLLWGAILAGRTRTVSAILRVLGLSADPHFQNYHRVLNRAVWSSLEVSRVLLALLLARFAGAGELVLGLDETLERRWGQRITARGIYRDPVRSSKSHLVKARGLRWLSVMLLAPVPWAARVWALPFLTVLAPSEKYYQQRGRAAKTVTDWARQVLGLVRRWVRQRRLVVVADSTYAALRLLAWAQQHVQPLCLVTRLRLDAALYAPAPPRRAGQAGRPRKKGERLPTLAQVLANPKTGWQRLAVADWYGAGPKQVELTSGTAVWYHAGEPPVTLRWVLLRDPKGQFKPQAWLSTDPNATPAQIVNWFLLRWRLEVTFHEVREHLGVETQRQWSDKAIARTTPALLGLFSLVTLLAHQAAQHGPVPVRQAAWYTKPWPTFVDALALVRQTLWAAQGFSAVAPEADIVKIPRSLFNRVQEILCYTGYA